MDKTADRYDRVASSAPLNRTAGTIIASVGVPDLEVSIPDHMAHFEAPPVMAAPPLALASLIGKAYGSLTVVGFVKSGKPACLVVRCRCNRYEMRKPKAVQRGSPDDHCLRCKHLNYVKRTSKRQAYFDRHGHWPETRKAPLPGRPA